MIELQTYVHNLIGGVDTKLPDLSLKPFESEVLINAVMDGNGLAKRLGTKLRTAAPLRPVPSKVISQYFYRNSVGDATIIAACDNGVNVDLRRQGGVVFDSGFSTGKKFSFAIYSDLLIYCNGEEAVRKYNGVVSANLGGGPPTNCKVVAVHNNFVLLANARVNNVRHPNRIYYSGLTDPESWNTADPGGDYIPVRINDGEIGRAHV